MKIHYDWEKIWEMKSWYPFSHYTAPTFKKCQKPIENIEFCWKISQNWGKIWEISSFYPFSHYTVQNFKNVKEIKIPEIYWKIPQIERKFGKFHLDIHLVIIEFKTSKNVKNHQNSLNLLKNPPKLRENLGNFILVSI